MMTMRAKRRGLLSLNIHTPGGGGRRDRRGACPTHPRGKGSVNQTTRYLDQSGGNPDISTLVGCLVLDAVDSGASDIHIEPWESSIAVRIRLNGVLSELAHLPLDFMERISG